MSYSENAIQKESIERLKVAVARGDFTATKRLLKGGVDVNATYWYESNLLHEAVTCGYTKILKLLIDSKADVNARNKDGRMPLHIACRNGNVEAVSHLLKANAHINARTRDGKTCLNMALWRCHGEIANMLVYKGADVNLADQEGWTALHWASKNNLLPCVETLISVGANINAQDKFGRSPLHESLATGSMRLLKFLLLHGADPDIRPKMPNTSTMTLLLKHRDTNPEMEDVLIRGGYSLHLDTALRNQLSVTSHRCPPPTDDKLRLKLLESIGVVPTLLHLSRLAIRRRINRCHSGRSILRKIRLLPLPDPILNYLALSDELPEVCLDVSS